MPPTPPTDDLAVAVAASLKASREAGKAARRANTEADELRAELVIERAAREALAVRVAALEAHRDAPPPTRLGLTAQAQERVILALLVLAASFLSSTAPQIAPLISGVIPTIGGTHAIP